MGNARLAGFQLQPSFLQPGTHQLLALPHDRLIPMQDHDIVSVANHTRRVKSRAPVPTKACPDDRFESVQGNIRVPPAGGRFAESGSLKGSVRNVLPYPLALVRGCTFSHSPAHIPPWPQPSPRAQKCSPTKFRAFSWTRRALASALFPFRKPLTDATPCVGGISRPRGT